MRMNGWMMAGCLAWSGLAGTAVRAEGADEPVPVPREKARVVVAGKVWGQEPASPEERQERDAERKRRFEIMVLMQAYKIMPEAERGALKAELLKRIEADLQQSLAEQKRKLAVAEVELDQLRKDIAQREKNAAGLAEKELDRLLRLPPPYQRRREGVRNRQNPEEQPGRIERPDGPAGPSGPVEAPLPEE